jgi:hypothetical protein
VKRLAASFLIGYGPIKVQYLAEYQGEARSMKNLVILGHGSGGTIIATKMRQQLSEKDWRITVIE